jgi:hypothetical protein
MHNFIPSPDSADGGPSPAVRGPAPAHSLAIKKWTRAYLRLDDDAVIAVSELACTDPGCPIIETVIAVFDATGSRKWKLTRPKVAVTKIMVQQALAAQPAGTGQKIGPPDPSGGP